MSAPAIQSPTAASASASAIGAASDQGHSPSGAAAEQSGPPRPFRDGPPPAARLHRHALESIFGFCGLRDLAAALRVSGDWQAAVQSMRRLELQMEQPAAETLVATARSTMGRHVADIRDARLGAETLPALAGRMAHLRHLHCVLQLSPAGEPLAFPAQLRQLEVVLAGQAGADGINAAIAAIGRLPLLEKLHVHLSAVGPQISFAPLAALPLLSRLSIRGPRDGDEFSDAQVDDLRALPRLQKIDVPMTALLLRRLLRQPHDLRWQQISLPDWLGDESAALLPLLPSLVSLLARPTCSSFDWLSGLPNLTNLRLTFFSAANAAGRGASLAAGLSRCPTVEILTIDNCADLAADQLAGLLPRLPRLRKLGLSRLSIGSLAFLSQEPLTNQLRGLRVNSCRRLPPADVRHIHSLFGLIKLELKNSFTAPLDEHHRALLTPPSAAMPLLEEFQYRAPRQ